jgi:hypothetical protein
VAGQHILDPADTSTNGLWKTRNPLPAPVRKFGRYPNTHDWKPGDLVLVSHVNPRTSQKIIDVQAKGGFGSHHACWHHAAGYIGADVLCEASVRQGVRNVDVHTYVGNHKLRVLRDESLSDEQRHDISIRMVARMGNGYSFGDIVRLYFRSFKGFWLNDVQRVAAHGSCICSSLYADAYSAVTLKMLTAHAPNGIVMPAALSASPQLSDIPLYWRQIAEV